jgi:hypothetical protein
VPSTRFRGRAADPVPACLIMWCCAADLKLENTLIKLEHAAQGKGKGKPPTPVLKIADFGFCKHEALDTPPKSRVGTPAYISPVRPAEQPAHCCWRAGRCHEAKHLVLVLTTSRAGLQRDMKCHRCRLTCVHVHPVRVHHCCTTSRSGTKACLDWSHYHLL